MARTVEMDKSGRIIIPKEIRDELGVGEGDVFKLERKDDEILLKPIRLKKNPAEAISEMTLPISSWERVEKEIERGAIEE